MFGTVLENVDENRDGVFDHARFSVRCSFIHAVHPLGFIRKLGVTVDGKAYGPDEIIFVLRKNWVSARYIPTISDIWWNIGEVAHIYLVTPGGVAPGEHQVAFTMEISTLFHTRTVDHEDLAHRIVMNKTLRLTTPADGGEGEAL